MVNKQTHHLNPCQPSVAFHKVSHRKSSDWFLYEVQHWAGLKRVKIFFKNTFLPYNYDKLFVNCKQLLPSNLIKVVYRSKYR